MRIATLLLALLQAAIAHAAEPPDAVLQAIAARLERPAVVRGEFTQERRIEGLSRPLVSRGRFVVVRGEGVLWDTAEPFPHSLRVTAQGVRVEEPAAGAAGLARASTGAAPREMNRMLGALFEADLGVLDRYFRARGELADSGWSIDLRPRADALARVFSAIVLRGDALLRTIELQEANGDHTRIRLESLATDTAPAQAERDALAP